ncbi:xanthine dehydrogenase small subunit [Piscinibacter gummiphilus]|uniref:Xanthine dehydrogenase small subunit n=1 Tax=Piscinibacter gummiphilus TaxID=946333 RepID=A0ABZ0D2U6_9BURK|nr:xanthine dehydrogenase small subunit [Piscinibacter gummiphilus]WOB09567.1 xanthine dehydrogenase small subunit [Piscinibacter gummiphilus]
MNPQPIRFYHRGAVVEVNGPHPTRSVLEWLREDARCTGTKEGCNEGDCGACTVVVGELAESGDGFSLKTVNACLQFLPTLDGKALFTVEDLKGPEGLHPTQQAMVECHGSQCGFCTPGFVMSLWSCYERHRSAATRPTRQELADELSGNLCRCTGYRPILDAGQRMFELPPRTLDTAPVVKVLQGLQRADGLHYTAFNRQMGGGERVDHFRAPRTLDALAGLREYHPDATLLAGATDIGLWVNKQFRPLGDILYLGEVKELQRIEDVNGELVIGAGVPLEAAWQALAQRVPTLTEVWLRFASPPIRHAGTMGGNVANGSPIGDSAPVLMALDAQLVLRKGTRVRRVALADFYVDYMKNQLHAGELVQAIAVPLPALQRQLRAYKISKRFDSDISAICAGLAIELNGDRVHAVRIALGGMAATVKRAAAAEAALTGQPWTQASVQSAQAALAQDFKPLTDLRASAAYRLQVAQNLLQRFWLETRVNDPLPPAATTVWARVEAV